MVLESLRTKLFAIFANRDYSMFLWIFIFFCVSCEDQNQSTDSSPNPNLSKIDAFLPVDLSIKDAVILVDQSMANADQSMANADQSVDLLDLGNLDLGNPILDLYILDQSQTDSNILDLGSMDMMVNEWPTPARPDTIYAHTDRTLYSLNVKNDQILRINDFSFDNGRTDQITDIAFDRRNVLWAISFTNLYICDAQSALCRDQGVLPSSFNGLSWISGSSIGRNDEVLVGIESSGGWFELTLEQGQIMSQNLGAYPFGNLSSGDAFSIDGIGTFASIKVFGSIFDRIVTINPQRQDLIDQTFVDLNGYFAIYGLAGWRGFLYAFDETGAILKINLQTKAIQRLNNEPKAWWGAGVSTILYSE